MEFSPPLTNVKYRSLGIRPNQLCCLGTRSLQKARGYVAVAVPRFRPLHGSISHLKLTVKLRREEDTLALTSCTRLRFQALSSIGEKHRDDRLSCSKVLWISVSMHSTRTSFSLAETCTQKSLSLSAKNAFLKDWICAIKMI